MRLDLVANTVGLTASPLSTAATTRHADASDSRSTSTSKAVAGYGHVVAGKRESPAAPGSPLIARPVEARRGQPNDFACPFILQMAQPELHRVRAGRPCQLAHEAFDREHIHVSAERAQRGNAQRHGRDEMMDYAGVRKLVERNGVPIAAPGRLRDRLRRWRRERRFQLPRRRGLPAAPGRDECVLLQTS